jgi:hypothetical protein
MIFQEHQAWASIDRLRDDLSKLGVRHPIARDAPAFRRGRKAKSVKLEPSGGAIVPIIQMNGPGYENDTDKAWDDFSNWRDELAKDEAKRGQDALAWYVSFHNIDPDWGIYIPISSLHYLAERTLKSLRVAHVRKLEIAFEALLHHESMHFAIDRNVAAWEVISGAPLHGHVPDRLKTHGYIQVEEAVANAHKLREMGKARSASCMSALDDWVAASPKGYCDASDYVDSGDFQLGLEECIKTYTSEWWVITKPNFAVGLPWIRWASQFPIEGPIDLTWCPVFVIDDQAGLGLWPTSVKYLQAIPTIIESRKFQKMFQRLPKQVQETWIRKREGLQKTIPAYPEFEKMKGSLSGIFSIRVGDNHRVHLKPSRTPEVWEAVAIGPHRAMGHG